MAPAVRFMQHVRIMVSTQLSKSILESYRSIYDTHSRVVCRFAHLGIRHVEASAALQSARLSMLMPLRTGCSRPMPVLFGSLLRRTPTCL